LSERILPFGRWQARYPGRAGRLVTAPTTYATKKEAAAFLASVEGEMAKGIFIDPRGGRTTLAARAGDVARPSRQAGQQRRP